MLTVASAPGTDRLEKKRATSPVWAGLCANIGAVCASVYSSVKWKETIRPLQGQQGDDVMNRCETLGKS